MKNIRKISANPIFIFLLLLNFMYVSCSRDEMLNEQSIKTVLSGEELFKSIIFADGQMTKDIAPLANLDIAKTLNAKELVEYRKTQNEAIEYIKSIDADYFNNFKNAMYSKNASTINNAINNMSQILTPFIQEKLYQNNIDYKSTMANAKKFKDEGKSIKDFVVGKQVCVYGAAVVAIAVVAVVAVVVVGFGYWWARASQDISIDNTIYKDEILLSIIKST